MIEVFKSTMLDKCDTFYKAKGKQQSSAIVV